MVKVSGLLSLISCLLLSSSSRLNERLSDYRKLLLKDEVTGKLVLYEFKDLDFDGNVEVCVSGDPERKIRVYCYYSKKHAEQIKEITGFDVRGLGAYSSKGENYPSISSEIIIMDEKDQKRANYLFALAEKLDR